MKTSVRGKVRQCLLLLMLFLIPTIARASGENTLLTLNYSKAPLKTVLDDISRQSAVSLVYYSDDIQVNQRVSVKATNEKLPNVMTRLLANTSVGYSIKGSYLVLYAKDADGKGGHDTAAKRIVKGVVKDESGEPMIGVSVLVLGTNVGTSTDLDGNYSIAVTEKNPVLEFSYIGCKKNVVPLGAKTALNIVMNENKESTMLEEVVVTAMGIERQAKSLTYAAQSIKGDELTRAKDANFINSLQGKSAGLVITPNTGGAGSSSKILLRGNSSILGNNQAMVVVDGVPLADRGTSQISDNILAGGTQRDGGDGMSNINPDDIESMTVLKGANAAALYGSHAANGVIIITTKRGSEGKPRVEFSSTLMLSNALVKPKFQNNYGATVSQVNTGDKTWMWANSGSDTRLDIGSWGQAIGTYTDKQLSAIPYAGNQSYDNAGQYLGTGYDLNNTLSVSGGTKNSSTYLSYGNTQAGGITPNNSFQRHIATFRQSVDLFKDRITVEGSVNYIKQVARNRQGSGIYANGLYDTYLMPRNANLGWFKNNYQSFQDLYWTKMVSSDIKGEYYPKYASQGNVQIWPWADQINRNNPYWTGNNLSTKQNRDRLMGMLGIKGKVIDGLTASAKLKIDYTADITESKSPKGMNSPTGFYESIYAYGRQESYQTFADFLINYDKKFKDFSVNVNFGGSTQRDSYKSNGFNYWMNGGQYLKKDYTYTQTGVDADGKPIYTLSDYKETEIVTATPNVFDPTNINTTYGGVSTGAYKTKDEDWTNGLYGSFTVGYKDWAYLDGSVRTDWSRTYTQFSYLDNPDHYTYFSIGGNVLLTDALKFKNEKISNLKARLSYSEVGNSIPNMNYGGAPTNWGSSVAQASAFRDFTQARPETMRSFEVGLEGSFFRNALTADLTYYRTSMVNQWLPKNAATGGQLPLTCGQISNSGFEATVSYTLMPTPSFRWRTSFNYSYNYSNIDKTYDGGKEIDVNPVYQGGMVIKYQEGKPYGEMYGKDFLYDANGNIQTDRSGAPKFTTTYDKYLGNSNSPHHLGWSNSFSYKDFDLYILVDGKIGGNVVSYTQALMDYYGVSEATGDARDAGYTYITTETIGAMEAGVLVPGVMMPDGNIAPAKEYYQATGGGEPYLSQYTYSATNLRLREASLGYTFRSLLGKGNNVSLSVIGRNLFFIHKKAPVDPDVSVSTANGYGGIEAFSAPTTRSYGISIKANF